VRPSHQIGKLGSPTGGSWADLQRSGYRSWLVDDLVSAIPRGSPQDLARFWHDPFALNAIRPSVTLFGGGTCSFDSATVHDCLGQTWSGTRVPPDWPSLRLCLG
jgi:hypothetical protein